MNLFNESIFFYLLKKIDFNVRILHFYLLKQSAQKIAKNRFVQFFLQFCALFKSILCTFLKWFHAYCRKRFDYFNTISLTGRQLRGGLMTEVLDRPARLRRVVFCKFLNLNITKSAQPISI